MLAAAFAAQAQNIALKVNVFEELLRQAQSMPIDNAKMILGSTMNALGKNPKDYRKAVELAERRLGNPADSLHNEELYIALLENITSDYVLSSNEKIRPTLLLQNARKNRIGTLATDIDFVTRDGKKQTLYEISSPLTLILFNDAECEACELVLNRLESSKTINSLIDSGKLTLLTINTGNNKSAWNKKAYPPKAINGWNKSGSIDEKGLYDLPSTPLFYLLDNDKKVLLKNEPSLNAVEKRLQREERQ